MRKILLICTALLFLFSFVFYLHGKAKADEQTISDKLTVKGIQFSKRDEHITRVVVNVEDKEIENNALEYGVFVKTEENTKTYSTTSIYDDKYYILLDETVFANHFEEVSFQAYIKYNDDTVLYSKIVKKKYSDLAASVVAKEEDFAFTSLVAVAKECVFVRRNGAYLYYTNFSQLKIEENDQIYLKDYDYSSFGNIIINQSNVTITGSNESIVSGILIADGVNNVKIEKLVIKGGTFDNNDSSKAWLSTSTESIENTSLSKTNTFDAGVVLVGSHDNIDIIHNEFKLTTGRYHIVDIGNGATQSFDNYKNSNLNISNNTFTVEHTNYTCDIFLRSVTKEIKINNNTFTNYYNPTIDSFSYDYTIRLWRPTGSIAIEENELAHPACNIALDMGYASNSSTILLHENNMTGFARRGVRILNVLLCDQLLITNNILHTLNANANNYTILISAEKSKSSSTLISSDIQIENNTFYGLTTFQYGFVNDNFNGFYNYFADGIENVKEDGTTVLHMENYAYGSSVAMEELKDVEKKGNELYKQVIKELAYAYVYQGNQIQYDQLKYRRNMNVTPDFATKEKVAYLDCSSFVNSVYYEAFGVNIVGTSPINNTTQYFDRMCEEGGEEVIAYTKTKDVATLERATYLQNIQNNLQVGDLLVYRKSGSGHVMLYVGNDIFVHCTGSSFTYSDNPLESKDNQTTQEKNNGAVCELKASDVFTSTGARYLFGSTIVSFGVIRVLNRKGLSLSSTALNRINAQGITIEKSSDVSLYNSVRKNDLLTITITIKNNGSKNLTGLTILDPLAEGCEYVKNSLSDNGVYDSLMNQVSLRDVSISAGQSLKISYQVEVKKASGTINLLPATINLIPSNTLQYFIKTTSKQEESNATLALSNLVNTNVLVDDYAYFASVYKTIFNVDLIGNTTKEVLDDLIDVTNTTLNDKSLNYSRVLFDLYGGLETNEEYRRNNERTRDVRFNYLETGDLILTYNQATKEYHTMIVCGKLLLQITNGKLTAISDATKIQTILTQLIAYDKFVILRP